jgi:hypothetical protein
MQGTLQTREVCCDDVRQLGLHEAALVGAVVDEDKRVNRGRQVVSERPDVIRFVPQSATTRTKSPLRSTTIGCIAKTSSTVSGAFFDTIATSMPLFRIARI